MTTQVVTLLSGTSPMRHCLLRRLLIADDLSKFATLLVQVISAVEAEPISIGNPMVECGVAVDVAAVEVTAIAYKQDVLIVSKTTLVAGVVVVLGQQHELPRFYLHFLRLHDASAFSLSQNCLEYVWEGRSAAGTDGTGLTPLLYTFEAELVQARQGASGGVVASEADRAHGIVLAALLVGDFCRFLQMLLEGGRHDLRPGRGALGCCFFDGIGEQHPPFLVIVI